MGGNTSNLMSAYNFFGPGHLAFATDFPFGLRRIGTILRSIEEMAIPQSEKEMILEGNARRILNLD